MGSTCFQMFLNKIFMQQNAAENLVRIKALLGFAWLSYFDCLCVLSNEFMQSNLTDTLKELLDLFPCYSFHWYVKRNVFKTRPSGLVGDPSFLGRFNFDDTASIGF